MAGRAQQLEAMPTSPGAAWTQMEQAIEKQPCMVIHEKRDKAGVIMTVQAHCNRGREDPEVKVPAQQQGQNMSSVNDELQLEWNKHEPVLCVQQQTAGEEMPAVCVTVQAQPTSQRDNIQHECVHKYPTSQYEDAPHIMLDHQETQCGGEIIAAEVEQQDREEASGSGSTPLQQVANDSVIKESLLQQDRWHQRKEYLKLVQFLQTDQSGNRSEAVATEKKRHCDCQDVETTKTNICPLGVVEKDTKKMSTKLHQKQACAEGSATHLQPLSSDEQAEKVIVQEMKDGREEQAVTQKPRRDMPNYFVAIPITNDQILDKIEDVQELIFTKEPDLLKALIPVQTMHLTIIVACLRTEDDVKRAVSALEHSKAKVHALLQGKLFSMTFRGIGQFNKQVIYVKMSEDEQQALRKIAEAVESSFREMDIDISSSKDFKPHLTLLKLSKAPALRRKGFRKIHEDLYMEYEDSTFGTEVVGQLDLCAMHKKKQDSGYYHCECSINVCQVNSESSENEKRGAVPLNDVHQY